MEKLTGFVDYFRKIPAPFLVAIVTVLALILFSSEQYAKMLAVDGFREQHRGYLGFAFLLSVGYAAARIYMFFMQGHKQRKTKKAKGESLHRLTPEEKGYLLTFIEEKQTSIYVSLSDGVMGWLQKELCIVPLTWETGFPSHSISNLGLGSTSKKILMHYTKVASSHIKCCS